MRAGAMAGGGGSGEGEESTTSDAGFGDDEELLSIGSLAHATGIACDTIRVWERRYGRPVPVRLPSGHRRYTPEHVRWLRRIAEALARGHRLGAVIQSSEVELDRLLVRRDPVAPDWELRQLADMARDFRGADLAHALRVSWKSMAPLDFLQLRIGPLLNDVGEAWADGQLQPRHEHFLSEVVDDLLRSLRAAMPAPSGGTTVALATLEGEDHSLGLQMAALVCVLRDVRPCILGRALPNAEIDAAVREAGAQGLAIGVSLANSGVGTDRTLSELRHAVPSRVRILVGGRGARGVRRGPRGIDYLTEPVFEDFARWLDALR